MDSFEGSSIILVISYELITEMEQMCLFILPFYQSGNQGNYIKLSYKVYNEK